MWIEVEVLGALSCGKWVKHPAGTRLLNTDLIQLVRESVDDGDHSIIWYQGVEAEWKINEPYDKMLDLLNGNCMSEISTRLSNYTQQIRRLEAEVQQLRDANVELRKDNMREFQAGMRHGDAHVRTALASAIVALEGIRDGKTDASQFDSSVFAAACLDQVKALLAEGEAIAKELQSNASTPQ